MSGIATTARRTWPRLGLASLMLAPASLALLGGPAPAAWAAGPGVTVSIDLDGATVAADGVLDLAVTLTNTLGVPADVSVAAGDGFACSVSVAAGDDQTCVGQQYAPTQLGTTTRDAAVVTRAEWGALNLSDLTDLTFGEHHGCALDVDQHAWCWGAGADGRLGNGSLGNQPAAVAVDGGHEFTAISAGQKHTCAIDTAGKAWCWGDGPSGQLGINSTADSAVPVAVVSSETFTTIAAGDAHTCALNGAGLVYCWGANAAGQLGRSPYNSAVLLPQVLTPTTRTFASVAAGGASTCGVVASDTSSTPRTPGTAMCWGSGYGLTPVAITPGPWQTVDVGADHACALASADDSAWCWGQDGSGQLGNGASAASGNTPVAVAGGGAYTSISAGDRYTCALSADTAWCWGESDNSRLGSSATDQASPVSLPGTWSALATTGSAGTSGGTTCALGTDQRVACWGHVSAGEAGAGPATPGAATPTPVALAGTVTQVVDFDLIVLGTAGIELDVEIDGSPASPAPGPWAQSGRPITKTYRLTNAGDVALSGVTVTDSIGDAVSCPGGALDVAASVDCTATGTMSNLPNAYAATATASARPLVAAAGISAGGAQTCVTTAAGVAWCWGRNDVGQLGIGGGASTFTSAQHVATFDAFDQVDAGSTHVCALRQSDGAAVCWGQGLRGQIGNGSTATATSPAVVSGGYTFTSVSAGTETSCGVVSGGTVRCWGLGTSGQLGNNSNANAATPVQVVGSGYSAVSVGATHTCVLTSGGAAKCFGDNAKGQLGTGTTITQWAPATVTGGQVFATVSAGTGFTCGLDTAGQAWCWGDGTSGRLGNGSTTNSSEPVPVAGGRTFDAISVGADGVCAVNGELWCWGAPVGSNVPVRVGTGAGWAAVSVGTAHRCAVDAHGGAVCWGSNSSGQIGDGTTLIRNAPVATFLPVTDSPGDSQTISARSQPSRVLTLTRRLNNVPVTPAPGPTVAAGSSLTLDYTVRNDGQLPLTNVDITEPGVTPACSTPLPAALAAGASFTCSATVTGPSAGTGWTSTATVTADWDDTGYSNLSSATEGPVTASATAAAWASATPSMTITGTANGLSMAGTGADVTAGVADPIALEYTVTNTGPVTVTGLSLTTAPGSVACNDDTLAPAASTICTTTTNAPAAGTTTAINPVARATWVRPDGTPVAVTAGMAAKIWVDATPTMTVTVRVGTPPTNSPASPGAMFANGVTIPVQFVVANTGPVALSGLSLTPSGATLTGLTCPATIAIGSAGTCTASITNANIPSPVELAGSASATWTNPAGVVHTASHTGGSWLYTEALPALSLSMQVSGLPEADTSAAPGTPIPPSQAFAVNYTVTNTGVVPLHNVTVSNGAVTLACATTLAVGASDTCASPFPALLPGQTFVHTGTATGQWTSSINGITHTGAADDTVYTWGHAEPAISLSARIGAAAQPVAPGVKVNPGSTVFVNLEITNTGPVPVSAMSASFGVAGMTCTFSPTTIAPGAISACSTQITAPGGGTQLVFAPSVTAGWIRPGGTTATATAASGLYAWVDETPTLTLVARIGSADANTAPGVQITANTTVPMTYVATNTSSVALTALAIGDPGVTVNCPATTLAAHTSMTCTASRPALAAGATLAATATATATWTAPDSTTRTATGTDPAYGWVDAAPSISLTAAVGNDDADVAPGPSVGPGLITLRSVVTNTGPVPVSGVTVTDDTAGTLGCPSSTLAPGASMTCTTTDAAPGPGAAWASVGTVGASWTNPGGSMRAVTASDPVHAWGAADATVGLVTKLDGLRPSLPPGLRVDADAVIAASYVVTNTSAVGLSEVALTAAGAQGLSCPANTLAAGAVMTCTATLVGPGGGAVANPTAEVTATWIDPTGARHDTSDRDAAYVWAPGVAGLITTFRVNGRSDEGDGISVVPGDPAELAVLVFNTGNVVVTGIAVDTTPGVGLHCPATELAVDGVMACTATLSGPAEGTSLAISARATGTWQDLGAGTRQQVDDTDQVTVFGSAAAPEPVVTLDPARLFESRPGQSTVDGQQNGAGRLGDGAVVAVKVTGRGGVPEGAATAVLNLTATGADGPGFVTVWPCTSVRPVASNLNYTAGMTVANTVVARLDDHGEVCLYALRATDLVVDVNGYANVGGLETINPARLLDTRPEHPTADGRQSGYGALGDFGEVRVQVAGRGGVPEDATAAVLNVIATETAGYGYLTVYPCGSPPNASTVNYAPSDTATNSIVAKLDSSGGVCVFTHAAAHVVVDVNGFARSSTGINAVVPARLVDTRSGDWHSVDGDQVGGGMVRGGTSLRVRVAGRGGVPAGVGTVMLNLGALEARRPGYLTAYPCSAVPPAASNLNFDPSRIVANSGIVQLDEQGDVCLYAYSDTNVLVDVTGYIER